MKSRYPIVVRYILLLWVLLLLSYFLSFITPQLQVFSKLKDREDKVDDVIQWGVENVGIYVRTTNKNFKSRLVQIINTFYTITPDNIFFITDSDPEKQSTKFNTIITTHCQQSHEKEGLCCKLQTALLLFLNSNKKWFCHSDDDTYLKLPHLFRLLRRHDHKNDFYIGKKSVKEILISRGKAYEFATGGGGYCLSKSVVLKMYPYVRNDGLQHTCERLYLPDDCVLGYLITSSLGVKLTSELSFHSHLEGLTLQYFKRDTSWISCSYLPHENDPRVHNWMYEIHCTLYPGHGICKTFKNLQ